MKIRNTAIRMMNEDLKKNSDWLKKNKLVLNKKKTNYMIFAKNNINNTDLPVIKIENEPIERVNNVKYLGIKIDEKLTLKEQTLKCTKAAASKTNLLYRISRNLTYDTKKVIFYSIVLPSFQYCSTIYITSTKEEIRQMQMIQNRAMRLILNCDFMTSTEFMLGALNWLSISQMIRFNVLICTYKMLKGLLPNNLSNNLILTNTIHDRATRQNNEFNLRLPNFNSGFIQNTIFYKGVQMYNALPNEIKKSTSLNVFKNKCKKYVKDNYEIL